MWSKEEYLNKEQYKIIYKNIDNFISLIQRPDSNILRHEQKDLINSLLWLLTEESVNDKFRAFNSEESLDLKNRFDRYNNTHCPDIIPLRVGIVGDFWSRDGVYFFKFHNYEYANKCPNLKSFLRDLKFKYDKARHLWFVKRFYSLNTIDFTLEMLIEAMKERLRLDNF